MLFKYCPDCGKLLSLKELGDEGNVPFCECCNRPFFDSPPPCIITLVENEYNEFALIKQGYVSDKKYVLVAGYIKTGESAEDTTIREVVEELGLTPIFTRYIKSYPYKKRGLIMLGFITRVKKGDFKLSCEVDNAEWFSLNEAMELLKDSATADELMRDYIKYLSGE